MRIFVTGGSGFIGGHILETLSRSHTVLAMARSDQSAARVEARGATAVRCSLEDVDASHLEGVDAIVHAAASVDEFAPFETFERLNVEGTRRMIEAARAAGVSRFVHISTNATVFDASGQLDVDEDAPYTGLGAFHYGTTKADAEKLVLAAHGDALQTVALRPCFVWGPGDTTLLPALRRMVDDGSFMWLDKGAARVSTTHVDNLVHAVVCALSAEVNGRAMFIADEVDIDVRGMLTGMAGAAGLELPERSVPSWLVRGGAALLEETWRVLGRKDIPPITRAAAWLMSSNMTVRTDRARAELGWAPVVDREQGLAQLVA